MKHDKPMKTGVIGLDGTQRMARFDRATIKKKKIKSPDTTKMHSVKYENTTYFFYNKKKMNQFIERDKHHELIGLYLTDEDKARPTINERFSFLNKNIQKNGTD